MKDSLLNTILGPNGLSTLVQPIVEVRAEGWRLHSVECLSRGPKGSLFERADVFFDYVRRKRAEVAVDRGCVALALKNCEVLPGEVGISVNVHASTLGRDAEFVDFLRQQAESSFIEMHRITVEIVEHSPAWNEARFLQNLNSLSRAGVQIALDDVGLGQSNYRMILDADPDCFKLDAYVVKGCHADPNRRAVLKSVWSLAQSLGSSLVAEGVENPADAEVLVQLGISLMQGYLFCRPIPVAELLRTRLFREGVVGLDRPNAVSSAASYGLHQLADESHFTQPTSQTAPS